MKLSYARGDSSVPQFASGTKIGPYEIGVATSLKLMAVSIGSGAGFQFGAPTTIAPFPNYLSSYDVMPDGRFLVTKPAADPVSGTPRQRVVVVQNWFNELKSKMSPSATRP